MGAVDRAGQVQRIAEHQRSLDAHAKLMESYGNVQTKHSREIGELQNANKVLSGRIDDLKSLIEDMEHTKLDKVVKTVALLSTFRGLVRILLRIA